MTSKRVPIGVNAILALFALAALLTSTHATAQREKVLQNFSGADGAFPSAGLVFDSAGNLYGTTEAGGLYFGGNAFKLTPPKRDAFWHEQVLHSMSSRSTDGANSWAGLTFDSAGNLYGTTQTGGLYGGGTVFELVPNTGGTWTEKILHNFNPNGMDGFYPVTGVIFDAAGNLYGTTYESVPSGYGIVYSLIPTQTGAWTENVLHVFSGSDGALPRGDLIMDASGNLYGTTAYGGSTACNGGCGTVFKLAGTTLTTLYSFSGHGDGHFPTAGLVMDASGNLYGTTTSGGFNVNSFCPQGCGVVFELSSGSGGSWTETVLHSLGAYPSDGYSPIGGLIFDAAGNLYGTAEEDMFYGGGTVFELSPSASGKWSEKTIHHFGHHAYDGILPSGYLVLDASGNLYGTTALGGAYDNGTVYEITP